MMSDITRAFAVNDRTLDKNREWNFAEYNAKVYKKICQRMILVKNTASLNILLSIQLIYELAFWYKFRILYENRQICQSQNSKQKIHFYEEISNRN